MARAGAQAGRGQGRERAFLARGHRHGRGRGHARRCCALFRLRPGAGDDQREPCVGQLLRRQAQEHDARLPHRAEQARAERRLPHQLLGHNAAHRAEIRQRWPNFRERHDRQGGRCHRLSGAQMARGRRRPLHRHRQLQHNARSGRGLDQLRHLSRHDPRCADRGLLHLARQAWPPDARQVPRAATADAGRRRLRRRSHDLPHGLERGALRRERIRDRGRRARKAGRGDQSSCHRPAHPGAGGDRHRRFCRARQRACRGAVRRVDRLLRQRRAARTRARHQGGVLSQRSHPARLRAAAAAR